MFYKYKKKNMCQLFQSAADSCYLRGPQNVLSLYLFSFFFLFLILKAILHDNHLI